jgi:hypothetical protein
MSESLQCPYCESNEIRKAVKEIHSAILLGIPQLAKYERGQKTTYTECECLECGRKFSEGEGKRQKEVEPEPGWVGRSLTVESRLGVKVPAEVTAQEVTVRVQTRVGEVIAKDQLEIQMKTAIINFDSPLLVWDADKLIGVMWGSGVSKEGYSIGIVQLVTKRHHCT